MVRERPLRALPAHVQPQPAAHDELAGLLRDAACGDDRAWERIVSRFTATIRGIARRHRLSGAQADDVAQATWLALLEHIHAIRDPAALGGWIATTAHRACLRAHQGHVRELLVDEAPELGDRQPSIDAQVDAAERERVLRSALRTLRERERRLMELFLDDPEVSYEQIAEALAMPVGSIGPTRLRCFARLRELPEMALLAPA